MCWFCHEIINSIESSKENCVRLAKEGKRLEIDIKKQKKELDELLERFDRFDFNEQKFHEIKDSVALLNKDLNKKLEAHKIPILDNKTYAFKIPADDEVPAFRLVWKLASRSVIPGSCDEKY